MSEVGALIIRLQAETAAFRQDMGKAQRDIQALKAEDDPKAFSKMGHGAGGLRTQLGLLDNAMRGNLPYAMADIVRKFSDSALVMNALPLAASAAGFVLLGEVVVKAVEKIEAFRQGMSKLQKEEDSFNTSLDDTTRGLHEKFLRSEVEVDNLTNNHLAALNTELQIIDDQNLDNLESSFKSLSKVAEQVFKQLHDSWVESWFLGDSGSKPMQDMFEKFQTQYQLDLASGNKSAAAKDLKDMTDQLQKLVDLEHQAKANQVSNTQSGTAANYYAYVNAKAALQKMGYGIFGPDELASAEQLLQVLNAMQKSAKEIGGETGNSIYGAHVKFLQSLLTGGKTSAKAALPPGMKSYYASLAKEAAAELNAQISSQSQVGGGAFLSLTNPSDATNYMNAMQGKQDLHDYRENIQDLREAVSLAGGYSEKLAALTDEEKKLSDWAAKLQLDKKLDPANAQRYDDALKGVERTLAKTKDTIQNLQSSWTTYFQKMRECTMDLSTTIRMGLQKSITDFTHSMSEAMAQSIVYGKSFGQAMRQVGAEVVAAFLQMGIQWLVTQAIIKITGASTLKQQKTQAAQLAGANAVASWAAAPWPIDMGAPAFGAAMMGAAMSFEVGGKIPGVGAVPIIGHGGETVVTKALTDRVERAEGHGSKGNGIAFHYHDNSTHQALDSTGMDAVLANHRRKIMKEVHSQLRRLNR